MAQIVGQEVEDKTQNWNTNDCRKCRVVSEPGHKHADKEAEEKALQRDIERVVNGVLTEVGDRVHNFSRVVHLVELPENWNFVLCIVCAPPNKIGH